MARAASEGWTRLPIPPGVLLPASPSPAFMKGWPLEFCTPSLLIGPRTRGRAFVGLTPPPQADRRRKPCPSRQGRGTPDANSALSAGARQGHPQGEDNISLGPVISHRVHRTLLGLTCNHEPSPPPPEATRSQIRSLWGYQASMDAGKAGQTLKTHCPAQVRAFRGVPGAGGQAPGTPAAGGSGSCCPCVGWDPGKLGSGSLVPEWVQPVQLGSQVGVGQEPQDLSPKNGG